MSGRGSKINVISNRFIDNAIILKEYQLVFRAELRDP